MPKFKMSVTLDQHAEYNTARIADGTGASNQLNDADVGKFVRMKGDSQYGMCAVGEEIEGILHSANDVAPHEGYNLGAVRKNGRVRVTLDGLQATPGTGVIAVGDYVVAGTPVARGTALGSAFPRVCRATAAASALVHKWRVISLDGTTAVGQTGLIERV